MPFYFTSNELDFSKQNKEHFYVYRVYNFKYKDSQAEILIIEGGLEDLNSTPVSFKVSVNI